MSLSRVISSSDMRTRLEAGDAGSAFTSRKLDRLGGEREKKRFTVG